MNKKMIAYQREGQLRAEVTGEEEKKKVIRGYPILFDSPADLGGGWKEYVRKGAFDGVDLSELLLLYQHKTDSPLAKNGINMRAEVDEIGLFIEGEMPNTATADEAYELVRLKIVEGMSCWFGSTDYRENLETKTVEIFKFSWIREVSIVTFPAYQETVIMAYEPQQPPAEKINKLLL